MKCCNTDHQIPALSSLSLAFSSPNAFDYPDYAPIPSPSPSSVPLFSQWTIPLHRYELFRVIPALTFSISFDEPSDPSLESAVFRKVFHSRCSDQGGRRARRLHFVRILSPLFTEWRNRINAGRAMSRNTDTLCSTGVAPHSDRNRCVCDEWRIAWRRFR